MKIPTGLAGNTRALAILRVASAPQNNSDVAFEDQESGVLEYAKKTGLDLQDSEVFRVVESGREFKGSQRERLIQDAPARNIRHIIFFDRTRMIRNLAFGDWDERLVYEDKIVIHFVKENCVVSKGDGCINISIDRRSEGRPS